MSDIHTYLVDALQEKWPVLRLDRAAERLVDYLLSLSRIAIVDLSNIDELAKVAAKNWPDTYAKSWPWEGIPERQKEYYRQEILDALR